MSLDRYLINYSKILSPKSYLHIGLRNQPLLKLDGCKKIGVTAGLPFQMSSLNSDGDSRIYEMSSDDFFTNLTSNVSEKFDMVFLNGETVYNDALFDILNALKVINDSGIIIVNNTCINESNMSTVGDVWKAVLSIVQTENVRVLTNSIAGVTLISKSNTSPPPSDMLDLVIPSCEYKEVKQQLDRWLNIQPDAEINHFLSSLKYSGLKEFLVDKLGIEVNKIEAIS